MTVTTTTDNRTQVTGNGVWDEITINWPMFQNSDGSHAIQVIKTTIATSATSTLTETTHYTVALDSTSPSTGVITLVGGAPSSAYRYTVLPSIPKKQEVDLQNAVQIDMPTIEAALDKLTLLIQAQDELLSRAVILAQDTTVTDITLPSFGASDANKVVTINGTGTGMTTISVDELVSVSSFDISTLTAETTVDGASDYLAMYDASAGAMRKVLANKIQTDITALTEDTNPDEAADYLLMYDTSAAANKKVLPNNIETNISGKTELTAGQIDTTSDMLIVYDASAGANKKVAPSNLGIGSSNNGDVLDIQISEITNGTTSITVAATSTWYDTGLSVSTTPDNYSDFVIIGGIISMGGNSNSFIPHYRVVRSDGKVLTLKSDAGNEPVNACAAANGTYTVMLQSTPILAIDPEVGTTSALTYKLQVRGLGTTGTLYINRTGNDTDSNDFGRGYSQLNLMRLKKSDNFGDTYTNIKYIANTTSIGTGDTFTHTDVTTALTGAGGGGDNWGISGILNAPTLDISPQNNTAKILALGTLQMGVNQQFHLGLYNKGSMVKTPTSPGSRNYGSTANVPPGGATISSYFPSRNIVTVISPSGASCSLDLRVMGVSTFLTATTFYPGRTTQSAAKYYQFYCSDFLLGLSMNTAKSGTPWKQIVTTENLAATSTSTNSDTDVTLNTAVTLTPTNASSYLLLSGNFNVGYDSAAGNNRFFFRLDRDGSPICVGDAASNRYRCTVMPYCASGNGQFTHIPIHLFIPAGSTSSTTITPYIWHSDGSAKAVNINRTTGDTDNSTYYRTTSELSVIEILPN